MMEKLLESENGGMIAAIVAIVAVFGLGELSKTARAGMEKDYEMSASVRDCGEVKVSPAKKSDADDDEEEKEEEPDE